MNKFAQYLPVESSNPSAVGKFWGIAATVTIGYVLFEGGMPEGIVEWIVAIVLALIALGFVANLAVTQFAAAAAPGAA